MNTITTKNNYTILLDSEDYEKILKYDYSAYRKGSSMKNYPTRPLKWSVINTHDARPYPVKRIDGKLEVMHRFIYRLNNIPIPDGMEIDHINNNVLDNRKENLRLVTRSYNNANARKRSDNTTGYKGVYKLKDRPRKKPYQAYITHKGKRQSLGMHKTAKEAAQAYNDKATELYGDHALLNP